MLAGANVNTKMSVYNEVAYPQLVVFQRIKFPVGQKCCLIVLLPVPVLHNNQQMIYPSDDHDPTYEDCLAHEWKLLCVPKVPIVHRAHEDVREEYSNEFINQEPKRTDQTARTYKVPVQAPGQKSHAFVVTCTTKDAPKDHAGVVGQAEYGDACQQRKYPWKVDASVATE